MTSFGPKRTKKRMKTSRKEGLRITSAACTTLRWETQAQDKWQPLKEQINGTSKPHAKTANDTLGGSGWKITSNDDQIRIRILKEGKSYSKKVKIVDSTKKQTQTSTESAFTAHYNAQKSVMKSSFMSKMTGSNILMQNNGKDPAINVYTEKLPPLKDESMMKQALGKKASS